MQAKDVMTPHVISVGPDDTVAALAGVLLEHGISAAPVVDGDELVGIVSEGDLVRRAELGTADRHRAWWLHLLTADETLAREYVRSHAARVGDVMVDRVVTVSEDSSLSDIATTLEKNHIKRVPVVRGGRLVGIVSRADLVRKLASQRGTAEPPASGDVSIREQVHTAMRSRAWKNPLAFSVIVTDGVVELWGIYRSEDERDAARVAAEGIPGVVRVEDHRTRMSMPYTG